MMKIAVPVTHTDQIDNHFGHCEFYKVFSISEESQIVDVQTLPSKQGCGCKSDIAQVLALHGVSIMLAGGIGNGAIHVLNKSGINVIRGCSGIAKDIVNQYISGSIKDSGSSCHQHDNDPEHVCSH